VNAAILAAWLAAVVQAAPAPDHARKERDLRDAPARMMPAVHTWLVPWDKAEFGADECFDQVRPFALALSTAGSVVAAYPEVLDAARERRRLGGRFVPVVVNDVIADGQTQVLKSPDALTTLLGEPGARDSHVAQLLEAARDFDGLEIDYERVPDALWPGYVDFIERLSLGLHRRGKKLYVDLEPRVFYDRDWPARFGRRITALVDGVDLMAYYEKGEQAASPGPATSLPWVLETARRALAVVPKEKLVTVLSLAGTDWTEVLPGALWRGERLTYGRTMKLMLESRGEMGWDASASCPFFKAVREGRPHEVWFENERSISRKVSALRGIGAANIGLWYWGRRHPDFKELGLCPTKGR